MILAARSYDKDLHNPERPPTVPLHFLTDGSWVWPGAVAYYLREHHIAPDLELLTRIRARNYAMPDVAALVSRRNDTAPRRSS